MTDEFVVRLTDVDADHLLALAEWGLNQDDLDLGAGLQRKHAEAAARKIEAVADMARSGVYVARNDARFEALLQHVHRTTHVHRTNPERTDPFGACRLCDELADGLLAEFGLDDVA